MSTHRHTHATSCYALLYILGSGCLMDTALDFYPRPTGEAARLLRMTVSHLAQGEFWTPVIESGDGFCTATHGMN